MVYFWGCTWSKNRLEIDRAAEIFSHAGAAAPDPALPDSEQLAGAELLHTCAHPRNLAFEMPGNRNGASDRGGDKHCDDHSRAWGWRGACLERLEKLQAVDEQLSNDTLAAGMDCFKNKKPELAERAFGKVLKLTSRRFNPMAFFEAKVPRRKRRRRPRRRKAKTGRSPSQGEATRPPRRRRARGPAGGACAACGAALGREGPHRRF